MVNFCSLLEKKLLANALSWHSVWTIGMLKWMLSISCNWFFSECKPCELDILKFWDLHFFNNNMTFLNNKK